jgi:arsenical pump membrane protein
LSGQQVLATLIFVTSLALLLVRPRRVPDWAAALGGGVLMVGSGLLPVADAGRRLAEQWDIFLFFLGLSVSSAVVGRAGVFRAAANLAIDWARGSQTRLLIGLYGVGVVVTAVLSNDATALLLTPVAFAVATRAGVSPRPYAFACAMVANAASFLLPVSNPSNLILLSGTPLGLVGFVGRLLVPSAIALVVTLAGLLLVFRDELSGRFGPSLSERVSRRARLLSAGIFVLGLIYIVAAALNLPLGVVAVLGGLALLTLDATSSGSAAGVVREVPWGLFPLFGGLLLLVGGAERQGLFGAFEAGIRAAGGLGRLGAPLTTLGTAVLANLINNLPAALVAASALSGLPLDRTRADLVAATIVGVNLGPNLTTIGSLATMLWLLLLRRRGLDVSAWAYLRIGVTITVPALVAAAAGLWLWLAFGPLP